ncbi:NAD-dependent epimerase/dehydratase family protein [Uliginosibacterium sp. H1]|uniref:NAD-dependent epimerase/dehydratase family protein n=1 Tax=Uliginosibacterium sp. H1 TaxID=3114757 RepID=UPI002E18060A|nr:NAD-dependent epimerase/dehydratase family protein [Uliginosibacterium sp. H1]
MAVTPTRRLKKRRILIIGAGDVVKRALPVLVRRFRVYALARSAEAADDLRQRGVVPLAGDLDVPGSLRRLAGVGHWLIHAAPPREDRAGDPRTRHLMAALGRGASLARRWVYISTSGVYGDCGGQPVAESRPLRPATARAKRRVVAEATLRRAAIAGHARLSILRAPGIYAAERLSLARLERGDPVLDRQEDVITNHVHADDLAHALLAALRLGKGGRAWNITDDDELPMGDYYDIMADTFDLPRPPRASRAECATRLTPMMMTFMGESRRLLNGRMKRELKLRLRYPHVIDGLRAIRQQWQREGR